MLISVILSNNYNNIKPDDVIYILSNTELTTEQKGALNLRINFCFAQKKIIIAVISLYSKFFYLYILAPCFPSGKYLKKYFPPGKYPLGWIKDSQTFIFKDFREKS